MVLITINNLSKTIGGKHILEDGSFLIKKKKPVGLIGRNGEGKTTILQMIAGNEGMDSGQVIIKKGLEIGYMKQVDTYDESICCRAVLMEAFTDILVIEKQMQYLEQQMVLTPTERILNQYGEVQENFAQAGGYEMSSKIDQVLEGLGVKYVLEMKWGQLSGGEQRKVLLAQVLIRKTQVLLLDEPTNHLDISAIDWLTRYLKGYDGGMVLVSHDRYFLDELCNYIIELEEQTFFVYHTNYSQYLIEREQRLLLQFQAYEDQQKKIKKMEQAIKQLRLWAGQAVPPNDALYRRAKSMEKVLARIQRIKKPSTDQHVYEAKFKESNRGGKEVFIAENISKSFADKLIFKDISLQINNGEKVALVGNNGVGKTTLISLLLGEKKPDSGFVKKGSNIQYAYLSQTLQAMDPEKSVLDVFRDQAMVSEFEARHILAKFLFYGKTVFQKTKYLSGGERMRLRLAAFVQTPVNTLVMDEPTNHLDIASKEILEESLQQFSGTLLVISHDRYFIDQVFEKVIWLENNKVETYLGNFSYAQQKRQS